MKMTAKRYMALSSLGTLIVIVASCVLTHNDNLWARNVGAIGLVFAGIMVVLIGRVLWRLK